MLGYNKWVFGLERIEGVCRDLVRKGVVSIVSIGCLASIFYVYITIVMVVINTKKKRKSADALSIPDIT
jgi:hypothetical protein